MFVKVDDKKLYGELVGIAIKSGWTKGTLPKWEEFTKTYGFLSFKEGDISACSQSFFDDYNEELTDVKTAKRCLGRKLEKLRDYVVVQLKNGVQVGCTPFDNEQIKELAKQIKAYKEVPEIKTEHEIDGNIINFYSSFDVSDLKQLAKDIPNLIQKIENSSDYSYEDIFVNNDGEVEYDGSTFDLDEVTKILKSFGYIK